MNESEILENQETLPAVSPTVDGFTEESRQIILNLLRLLKW